MKAVPLDNQVMLFPHFPSK